MSKTQDAFILKHRTDSKTSRITGGTYWRFTWYRVSDGTLWETTVDTTMRNYSRWRDLCESKDPPWGIYRGITTTGRHTNQGAGIATADAAPERDPEFEITNSKTTRGLIEANRASLRQPTTTFDQVFTEE